jgi:ABC-type dipeptide/oligopeptide/nickel transport system ATPase component
MSNKINPVAIYENIQVKYTFFTDKDTSTQYIANGLNIKPFKDKIDKTIDNYIYEKHHTIQPIPKGVANLLSNVADNNVIKTYIRTAHIDDYYYYKCDNDNIIKIGSGRWDKSVKDVVYFRPSNLTTNQVKPLKSDISLYDELLDIRLTKSERILLMGALVAGIINDINHPIINIVGDAGVGKTMLGVHILDIVDPSESRELGSLNSDANLKLTLSNRICAGFDNLSNLTQSQSDILATSSTGGSDTKRVLYSDNNMITTVYNCMVVVTGVDDTFRQPDILSRTLHIHLQNGDKLTMNGQGFKYDIERIPYILGAIFDNLVYYIDNKDSITTPSQIRLDDWYYVTLLTAINNGFTKEEVDNAFKINSDRNIDQVISSSIIGKWIIDNVTTNCPFVGKIKTLYQALKDDCGGKPPYKTPATLGKALKKITPQLENIGYVISDKDTNTNIFRIEFVGNLIQIEDDIVFNMDDQVGF